MVTTICQLAQILELLIIEAESFDKLGSDSLLNPAAVWKHKDGNFLESRAPFQPLTLRVDAG